MSYDVNQLNVSGRLAKDAVFRETDGRAPSTEVILVNSRNIGARDQDGRRRSTITTIKIIFRGAKARKVAEARKGDELICFNGCLQDDNVSTDDEGGRTIGRLKVENVQRFVHIPKKRGKESPQSFEDEMLASEEEPLSPADC